MRKVKAHSRAKNSKRKTHKVRAHNRKGAESKKGAGREIKRRKLSRMNQLNQETMHLAREEGKSVNWSINNKMELSDSKEGKALKSKKPKSYKDAAKKSRRRKRKRTAIKSMGRRRAKIRGFA